MCDYQDHHKSKTNYLLFLALFVLFTVSFEFFISGNRALTGTIIGLELHYFTRNHRVFVIGYMLLCLVIFVNY